MMFKRNGLKERSNYSIVFLVLFLALRRIT